MRPLCRLMRWEGFLHPILGWSIEVKLPYDGDILMFRRSFTEDQIKFMRERAMRPWEFHPMLAAVMHDMDSAAMHAVWHGAEDC